MITLASSGIDSVPADYVKNFLIMVGFLCTSGISAYVAYSKGKKVSGTREDPVNIKQPLHVREVVEHAEKPELEKLKDAVTSLMLTVNSNHSDLKSLGAERGNSIKETLRKEVSDVMREMMSFKDEIKEDFSGLRERIASVETRLDHIKK